MANFHDFLVEHAKFPFPPPDELQSVSTTDISTFEAGLIPNEWRAKYAVRDNDLVQKLCNGLKNTLGDTVLSANIEKGLLTKFSPQLEYDEMFGVKKMWSKNPSEVRSRRLLQDGVYEAARGCLFVNGRHELDVEDENSIEGGTSKVDYVLLVGDKKLALCEAKSPSVMRKVGEGLPERGFKLDWVRGQVLIPKILTKVALYLGLRRMEWLFLTCHNYWIVCRLVNDDHHPFLAYSRKITIKDSSEPFRAFLGAILSALNGTHIESSTFDPAMELDTIIEDKDEGPLLENDIDDDSGAYQGGSGPSTTEPPVTRSRARRDNAEPGLMITSSSHSSPTSFQLWVNLKALSNNTLALPVSDKNGQPCLWLNRPLGSGSTGNVWECNFDKSDDRFAVKIVESLRSSETDRRKRLHKEFAIYLAIEAAYQSGKLRDRITPRCYGAFEGDGVDVLVLDLCDGILNSWDEFDDAGLAQVYKLAQDLHRIGIMHGDLEPRNVIRAPGGLRLIDFSHSKKHICKENATQGPVAVPKEQCSELEALRRMLSKRQLLKFHPVDVKLGMKCEVVSG